MTNSDSLNKIKVVYSPVFHLVIDNLLGQRINEEIFNHIISLKDHFVTAQISGNAIDQNLRSNTLVYLDKLFGEAGHIAKKTDAWPRVKAIRAKRSPLLRELDNLVENPILSELMESAPFPLCKFNQMDTWETQLSRYGDVGQFFLWHCDRTKSDKRAVSVIYYVFKPPPKFTGGELSLTNGLHFRGRLIGNPEIAQVSPTNDRLVIFGSRTVHSVQPTSSPIQFEDGRFSVNIWIGRERLQDLNDVW